MQRTSHAIIITGAMIVFFMHKRLNLMAILDNWLMPPFILMTLGTVLCLTFLYSLKRTKCRRGTGQRSYPCLTIVRTLSKIAL